jgi:hypothetical protein
MYTSLQVLLRDHATIAGKRGQNHDNHSEKNHSERPEGTGIALDDADHGMYQGPGRQISHENRGS